MKLHALPAVAWIALGFAALLILAVICVHLLQVPAQMFMPLAWWWFDIAGLAVATITWFARALNRAPEHQLT